VWPAAEVNRDYLLMVVAVLGTTISPYLFFWQASQEVEDMKYCAEVPVWPTWSIATALGRRGSPVLTISSAILIPVHVWFIYIACSRQAHRGD
jgi:Mn2+/Fe2+ NRAMP family transporter